VIVGPNASGKSELGVKLAKKLNGEIISADSRQVYKKLDVGSGKVRGRWKKGVFIYKNVTHRCIDIADPKKVFTALDFRKCAEKAIADLLSRGKTPIIVGGAGFYIDAALGRIKLGGVPPDPVLRKKLADYSTTQLLNYLTELDPARAKSIEQKNPRRLIRAIEIASAKHDSSPKKRCGVDFASRGETNDPLNGFFALFGTVPKRSEGQKGAKPSEPRAGGARMSEEGALVSPKNILWLGIKRMPEELKKRIRTRLIKRLLGIIREVKKLRRSGVSWKRLYDFGLEYRYISLYLRGRLDYKLMATQLQTATWHYAKRQMTYFKKNKEIRWISANKEALRRVPISIKDGK